MLAAVIKGSLKEAQRQIENYPADLYELRLDDIEEFKQLTVPLILTYKNLNVEYIDSPQGNLRSYHNFKETPEDLETIYKPSSQLFKIATYAHSSLDTLRILQMQKKYGEKLVCLAMGELGQPSRILGRIYGAPFTFAAVNRQQTSAPGQLTLAEYQNYPVNRETAVYGLIGDPVGQSISHVTHNAFFRKRGINAVYVKFKVAKEELQEFLQRAQDLGFSGLSVTSPLKEAVLPYLDNIDPVAEAIGAVNTLIFQQGKIAGYNTDILALRCIQKKIDLKGKTVQIHGAGGAARALIYGCRQAGANLLIHNRTEDHARNVAKDFQCQVGLHPHPDLAINCTAADFPSQAPLAMDLRVRPKETLFLQGCHTKIYGYEMFAEQALGQFNLWNRK